MQVSASQWNHWGAGIPAPEQTLLQAGPLSLVYEQGSIRQIRLGNHLIGQQIYCALRDQNWDTIEPIFSDLAITQDAKTFQIHFHAQHIRNDINFGWDGTITGAADGTIIFHMDGVAHSTFLRNRVGFCVLHPANCAGVSCVVENVYGQYLNGSFPHSISPHQPFSDIRAIIYEVAPGLDVEIRMEGATFEMEDQRNWTDASFKSYCTPLGLPFPVQLNKGDRVIQTITLRLVGTLPVVTFDTDELQIVIGTTSSQLPPIGLCCASNRQPLSAHAIERLQALQLDHLRLDLDLRTSDYAQRLNQACVEARQIGASLQIALTLSANASAELQSLATQVAAINPPVSHWLVFHPNEKSTAAEWVVLARQILAAYTPAALFGGGTDAFFTELNRGRPLVDAMDFVSFSTNPQVHAFDTMSLVETLPIHTNLISTARTFVGICPIMVSPVSFKMRWNPNATGAATPAVEGELPHNVDIRQLSLFGAGWTLGSMKYLAEAGANSLTYYETCGWLGIMESEAGSPLPDLFPSLPGSVFPMYHLFADLAAFVGGQILHSVSSDPTRIVALILRHSTALRLLIANLSDTLQSVQISGAGIDGTFALHQLDETTIEYAMREPEAFRTQHGEQLTATSQGMTVRLQPYALLRLDRIE